MGAVFHVRITRINFRLKYTQKTDLKASQEVIAIISNPQECTYMLVDKTDHTVTFLFYFLIIMMMMMMMMMFPQLGIGVWVGV